VQNRRTATGWAIHLRRLRLALILSAAFAFGTSTAHAAPLSDLCSVQALPSQVHAVLARDFAPWKIQDPESLSESARRTWESKKPQGCPGIAVGSFQDAKFLSYALLLVPSDHPDSGYKLLILSRRDNQSSFESTVVEHYKGDGSSNYFICRAKAQDFFDASSKAKCQPQAPDVILMIDSGKQEYESDILFWSNGRIRQEPVDD